MKNKEITKRLFEIKEQVSKLGVNVLKDKIPLKIDDMLVFLEPFVNIEIAIKKENQKLDNDLWKVS